MVSKSKLNTIQTNEPGQQFMGHIHFPFSHVLFFSIWVTQDDRVAKVSIGGSLFC